MSGTKNTAEKEISKLSTISTSFEIGIITKTSNFFNKSKILQESKKLEIDEMKKGIFSFEKKIFLLKKKNEKLSNQIGLKEKDVKKSKEKKLFSKVKKQKKSKTTYSEINLNISKKIIAFYKSVKKNQNLKKPLFIQNKKFIFSLLSKFFGKKIKFKIRGSFKTKLFMDFSNLNILIENVSFKNKNSYFDKIEKFHNFLKSQNNIKTNSFVKNNSIIILNFFRTDKNGPQIDLTFKNKINKDFPCNEEIIKKYLENYPISIIFYFCLRKMLNNEKIDDPNENGLNSFCVFLLIIEFLQKINFPVFRKIWLKKDFLMIGIKFLEFFHFYSYTFDFFMDSIKTKILKNKYNIFKNNNKTNNSQKFFLTISNPYRTNIVLTRSFRKTHELQEFFKLSYINFFSEKHSLKLKKKRSKKKNDKNAFLLNKSNQKKISLRKNISESTKFSENLSHNNKNILNNNFFFKNFFNSSPVRNSEKDTYEKV